VTTETTAPNPSTLPADRPAGPMWKLLQNPNRRYNFKISDEFLFGGEVFSEQKRLLGDFITVDVKKQGDRYAGLKRIQTTVKVRDSSPQLTWQDATWIRE
jgi:hypothetical protein